MRPGRILVLAFPGVQALQCDALAAIKESWGLDLDERHFDLTPRSVSPPLVYCANFLTAEECATIIRASCRDDAEECTEYLNHLVNNEAAADVAWGYDHDQAELALDWSAGARAGRRTRLPSDVLDDLVAPRALGLLGLTHRRLRVADQLYYRPNRACVVVRDATVVRYRQNEGVAPHVDGKDATLLVYLNSLPPGAGGRTVFPDQRLAFTPSTGDCLIYDSHDSLLHFAEPVYADEKWVLQLLVDFRISPGEEHAPLVDWDTGQFL